MARYFVFPSCFLSLGFLVHITNEMIVSICYCTLLGIKKLHRFYIFRRQCHEIFGHFFHESNPSGPLINRLKCLKNLFSRSSIYLYIFGTGKWKASRININWYFIEIMMIFFWLGLLLRVLTILQIRLERERERQDNGTFNGFLCKSSQTKKKPLSLL